ncbi:hypothetical protein SAMN02910292_03109 [Lachnospiraceae bacterium XBB2008]|nr:hypothetical protein SAMN02910292_03109 [Lachnospiraceae bacterium XBB2008]
MSIGYVVLIIISGFVVSILIQSMLMDLLKLPDAIMDFLVKLGFCFVGLTLFLLSAMGALAAWDYVSNNTEAGFWGKLGAVVGGFIISCAVLGIITYSVGNKFWNAVHWLVRTAIATAWGVFVGKIITGTHAFSNIVNVVIPLVCIVIIRLIIGFEKYSQEYYKNLIIDWGKDKREEKTEEITEDITDENTEDHDGQIG